MNQGGIYSAFVLSGLKNIESPLKYFVLLIEFILLNGVVSVLCVCFVHCCVLPHSDFFSKV